MDQQRYLRHPGPRWNVVYGSYTGIEQVAVNELQRSVQRYLPYVVETCANVGCLPRGDDNLVVVGTASSNPLIADLVARKLIKIPTRAEGYALSCLDSPWPEAKRVLAIAGSDAKGVLNGVHAFGAEVLALRVLPDTDAHPRRAMDELGDFAIVEEPAIENRGIWTWGYVIHDYRRFLDNMARLRMNIAVIWNDFPPINAADLIAYAHARGIQVVFGFHWGWGLDGIELGSAEHREAIRDLVLRNYKENYKHLDLDGIYFQTLTEHSDLEQGGGTTASLACDWVNAIARGLLEKNPNLSIRFGLHATSIGERYTDLKPLDERVTIMWEDAGALPFSYYPTLDFGDEYLPYHPRLVPDLDSTLEYSKRLATLRPDAEFAMVPKGFINLRWTDEFENHGPFVIGERCSEFVRRRAEERQPAWDFVNRRWFQMFPHAMRFYREIMDCKPRCMTVAALVEDGLFEERIQPSIALYAETLWNPRRRPDEVLARAMSSYYLQPR